MKKILMVTLIMTILCMSAYAYTTTQAEPSNSGSKVLDDCIDKLRAYDFDCDPSAETCDRNLHSVSSTKCVGSFVQGDGEERTHWHETL